jgi:acetate kinase
VIILVINAGSSSVKYQVIDTDNGESLRSGSINDIGLPGGVTDHNEAIVIVLDEVGELGRIDGVGHRVVHGGERYSTPTVITAEVEDHIHDLASLAPLHNPANLAGIRAAQLALPDVAHVAVFDTAFHRSLSLAASTIPIPADLATAQGVRKYGFHGTSHHYVSDIASQMLGGNPEEHRVITLHLGNGSSVAAVNGGVCVETSMGFTPLQGLVMGTRAGDIDPAIVTHLLRTTEMTVEEIDAMLNTQSGLKAIAGTSDFRDITAGVEAGDSDSILALDVWSWRIRHYIGAYTALLGGLDALVFTGGIGENSALGRARATAGISFMGIQVDDYLNERSSNQARTISPAGTAVKVMVIPTNEELSIARQSAQLISAAR